MSWVKQILKAYVGALHIRGHARTSDRLLETRNRWAVCVERDNEGIDRSLEPAELWLTALNLTTSVWSSSCCFTCRILSQCWAPGIAGSDCGWFVEISGEHCEIESLWMRINEKKRVTFSYCKYGSQSGGASSSERTKCIHSQIGVIREFT